MLTVLDLFSGIGGFSLGLERTGGFRTVAFCEIEPYCRAVLRKHWPDVPIFDDVTKLGADDVGPVDVICGGFPCQDISVAGKQAGIDGERSGLWSEFARLIGELRPQFAIVENVSALLHNGLGRVLGDLAALGYDAEWHCIPASAVGAAFEGDRIWLVTTPNNSHGAPGLGSDEARQRPLFTGYNFQRTRTDCDLGLAAARRSAGKLDGFSDFLDRRRRTEALGNAVVPQVVEVIGNAILEAKING